MCRPVADDIDELVVEVAHHGLQHDAPLRGERFVEARLALQRARDERIDRYADLVPASRPKFIVSMITPIDPVIVLSRATMWGAATAIM